MKNQIYESTVLINAALDDPQIEGIIAKIKETIATNGGEIKEIENWGRKRLAYTVNKSKIGYYAVFRFNAPTSIISKLERFYTLDDHILRFINIKLDALALEQIEKNKAATIQQIEPALEEIEPTPKLSETEDE
ncbi:MAG: 30S ribosomal protein S6 [Ignavibacteriaceae bacterium]|nr:30S ribosomal protein S6 [Ignavibacteriaceae bacterium]